MKVKVDFTVEVNSLVMRDYMAEIGRDDETIPAFVREFFLRSLEDLDLTVYQNLGVKHETRLTRIAQ